MMIIPRNLPVAWLLLGVLCHAAFAETSWRTIPTRLTLSADPPVIAVGQSLTAILSGGQQPIVDARHIPGACGYGRPLRPDELSGSQTPPDTANYWRLSIDNGPWRYQTTSMFQFRSALTNSLDPLALLPGEHMALLEGHQCGCLHDFEMSHGTICPGPHFAHFQESLAFRIVAVRAVHGPEPFRTDESGDGDFLSLPIGTHGSRARFTAEPYPAGDWPDRTPTWSAVPMGYPTAFQPFLTDEDNPGMAMMATDSPMRTMANVRCGLSSVSFQLNVVAAGAILPSGLDVGQSHFNLFGLQPIDDGDDDPDTVCYALPAVAGGILEFSARPDPVVPESRLPQAWSFTGGDVDVEDSPLFQLSDASQPRTIVLDAACGASGKQTTILLSRMDLDIGPSDATDSSETNSLFRHYPAIVPEGDTRSNRLLIMADDGDEDGDGILDNQDCQIDAERELFTEIRLRIENFPHLAQARFRFEYPSAALPQSGQLQQVALPPYGLRLWRHGSRDRRDARPVQQGGDFLAAGQSYSPEEIGLQFLTTDAPGNTGEAMLYLEGCSQSALMTLRVVATANAGDTPSMSSPFSLEDSASIACISLAPSFQEAGYTGGRFTPASQLMTFGMPLVINDDCDEYLLAPAIREPQPDCHDAAIAVQEDLSDLGRLSLGLPLALLPTDGAAHLSVEGPLRLYLSDPPYRLVYDQSQLVSDKEMYQLLSDRRTLLMEAYGEGLARLSLAVNDLPQRTLGLVRLIRATRHLVTPDPAFETLAAAADDDFRQSELMPPNSAVFALQELPEDLPLTGQLTGIAMTSPMAPISGTFPISGPTIRLELTTRTDTHDGRPKAALRLPDNALAELPAGNLMLVLSSPQGQVAAIPLKTGPLFRLTTSFRQESDGRPKAIAFNPCNSALTCRTPSTEPGGLPKFQTGHGLQFGCQFVQPADLPGDFATVLAVDGGSVHRLTMPEALAFSAMLPSMSQACAMKWEGFGPEITDEGATSIWRYPDEAKRNSHFASPEALAREGRYIVRLEAYAFPDATQRQILEFGAEVRYGAPPLP